MLAGAWRGWGGLPCWEDEFLCTGSLDQSRSSRELVACCIKWFSWDAQASFWCALDLMFVCLFVLKCSNLPNQDFTRFLEYRGRRFLLSLPFFSLHLSSSSSYILSWPFGCIPGLQITAFWWFPAWNKTISGPLNSLKYVSFIGSVLFEKPKNFKKVQFEAQEIFHFCSILAFKVFF